MGGGEEEGGLEFTPTWVVAVVCTIIIAISLLVERCIHYGGQVTNFSVFFFLKFCTYPDYILLKVLIFVNGVFCV